MQSLGSLMYQANDPPVHVIGRKRGTNVYRPQSEAHPDGETFPGQLILRTEGRSFFANAQRIADRMAPLGARLGRERVFFNVYRAVEVYLARQSFSGQ